MLDFKYSEDYNWESVKSFVGYQLINLEQNKENLDGKVYDIVCDLAKVYYVDAISIPGENPYWLITEDALKTWGVSKRILQETADQNMLKSYPPVLTPITAKAFAMMAEAMNIPNIFRDDIYDDDITFVLEAGNSFGAAALLYPGLLKRIRDKFNEDFYILPESVDSVLIYPEKRCNLSVRELNDILAEGNRRSLPEKYLSNKIYKYVEGQDMFTVSELWEMHEGFKESNPVPSVIGYAGAWRAIQHSVIDGHDFWLMENDNYCDDEKPFVVINDFGRVILTHVESNLYDEDMINILQKTLLSVEKMPDETITIEEMQDYGYAWSGMLPMREKAAYEVMKNCEVFRLYSDDTEGMIDNDDEISEHAANGGIFGVERAQWKSFLEKHSADNKEE